MVLHQSIGMVIPMKLLSLEKHPQWLTVLANQKYGGIQFDSHLCIILANISARELAESFAHEEVSAHYHRFADSMGEYYVGSTEYLQAFFNEVFVQRYWKLLSWRQLITDD